jgi:hypothetical protein
VGRKETELGEIVPPWERPSPPSTSPIAEAISAAAASLQSVSDEHVAKVLLLSGDAEPFGDRVRVLARGTLSDIGVLVAPYRPDSIPDYQRATATARDWLQAAGARSVEFIPAEMFTETLGAQRLREYLEGARA